jgi:hypothetical protein
MPGDFGDSQTGRSTWEGSVDPLAPSVSNGQISPAQWAEYQSKRKRDAILGVLGVLGGAMGGSALSYGLGGYGAAAGGAGGSASVPGAIGAAEAPLGMGSVAGGASLPSAATGAMAPLARTVAMNGPQVAGGGGIGGMLGKLSPRDWLGIGTGLAGTIGGALSKPENMNPTTATTDPQLAALMKAMQGRLDKSEPLYDSVLQMANGLLPTQYQKGGGGMP